MLFNGTSSRAETTGIGGVTTTATTARTAAAICRRNTATTWDNIISLNDASGQTQYDLAYDDTGILYTERNGAGAHGPTITGTGWRYNANDKASGTSTPRYHYQRYGVDSAVQHSNSVTGTFDPGSTAVASIQLGNFNRTSGGDWFDGDILAAAVWNRQLADWEHEWLASSLNAWFLLGPAWLVIADYATIPTEIPDLSGNGAPLTTLTSISATASSCPVGWGAPATIITREIVTSSNATVDATGQPADATGTAPAPTVSAGAGVDSPAADGTGDTPNPTPSADATVTTPPADGTGDTPAPTVTSSGAVLTTDQIGADDTVQVGLSHQYQRGTFTTAGRDWVIYADKGTLPNVGIWITSTTDDGAAWEPAALLRELDEWDYGNNAYFDTHFDGTHLHYAACGPLASGGTNTLLYRRGTPQTDGTVTWDAAEQTAFTGNGSILEVGINTDSDGVPWIAFEHFNVGTSGYPIPKVTKATASDGTWTTDTGNGFPYTLSTTETRWWGTVVRLNETGGMCVFYWHSNYGLTPGAQSTILAQIWDGTDWTAAGEIEVDASPRTDQFGGGRISDFAVTSDPGVGEAYAIWYEENADEFQTTTLDITGIVGTAAAAIGNAETALYVTAALGLDTNTSELVLAYTNNDTELRTVRRTAGTWGASTQLAAEHVRRSSLQITERGSRLVVAWQENTDTGREPIHVEFLETAATDATVIAVPADATGDAPNPTVFGGATVTAPPVDGTGSVPAPAVTGGATVTAPPVDGTGDVPSPAVSADASVTAPPLDAIGSLPPLSQLLSALIDLTGMPMVAPGSIPAPSVSGSATGQVTSPPITGTGDVVSPSVAADAAITSPSVDGAGDVPDPSVSIGAGVTAPPVDGTGDVPDPSVAAGSSVSAPPVDGIGDVVAPTVTGQGGVVSPGLQGTGDIPSPSFSVGAGVAAGPLDGAGALKAPSVSAGEAGLPRIDLPTTVLLANPQAIVRIRDVAVVIAVDPALDAFALRNDVVNVALDPELVTLSLDAPPTGVFVNG